MPAGAAFERSEMNDNAAIKQSTYRTFHLAEYRLSCVNIGRPDKKWHILLTKSRNENIVYSVMESLKNSVDVAIIGGGAAGIPAALWCDELGLKAMLIEQEDSLGGQ